MINYNDKKNSDLVKKILKTNKLRKDWLVEKMSKKGRSVHKTEFSKKLNLSFNRRLTNEDLKAICLVLKLSENLFVFSEVPKRWQKTTKTLCENTKGTSLENLS